MYILYSRFGDEAYPNGSGATCDEAEAGVVLYPVIFVVLTYFLVYDVTTKSGSQKEKWLFEVNFRDTPTGL